MILLLLPTEEGTEAPKVAAARVQLPPTPVHFLPHHLSQAHWRRPGSKKVASKPPRQLESKGTLGGSLSARLDLECVLYPQGTDLHMFPGPHSEPRPSQARPRSKPAARGRVDFSPLPEVESEHLAPARPPQTQRPLSVKDVGAGVTVSAASSAAAPPTHFPQLLHPVVTLWASLLASHFFLARPSKRKWEMTRCDVASVITLSKEISNER